ncbi:MAG: hypothetical protein ACKVQS_12245, partial [Fimbriimonadaceae bacterium]
MLPIAATLFIYSQPQIWRSGELSVEVNKETSSWRILLPNSNEIYQSKNIESIAYVLLKEKELTLTGTKEGRTFFTKFTPTSSDTLHIETTYLSDRKRSANHLLEEFIIPETLINQVQNPGLAPNWKTPYLLYSSEKASISIWPDLVNWNLTTPMPAELSSSRIGYQNANQTEDGTWESNTSSRPVPTKTQFSFYIQGKATPTTNSEIRSIIWSQQAARFRAQGFPQQIPMTIAAAATFKFDRFPALQLFEAPESTGPLSHKRWKTLGEPGSEPEQGGGGEEEEERGIEDRLGAMGLPDDQDETIVLNSRINAMRVATAMYSWGNAKEQNSWEVYSKQLTALIIKGSPENGFSSKIVADEDGAETPESYTSATSSDEAATAFYAVKLLIEFPEHPLKQQLTYRIVGVLKRLQNNKPTPESSALIALAASNEAVPAEIRQLAVENLVPLQATFSIEDENKDNPWTLETLYWLHQINPTNYKTPIKQLVEQHLANQSLVDIRQNDQLASFGAFRTSSGAISADTATLASIIGRLAIALEEPEWLDRSAFALRSLHNLYVIAPNTTVPELLPEISIGISSPGFGNVLRNEPDPRINFEGSEGLLNAATWELLQQTHGAYIFKTGLAVGIDGLAASPDNQVRNSLFGNPIPFAKAFQEGVKRASSSDITASNQLTSFPAITSLSIERRGNEYFALASPGLSINNFNDKVSGTFTIGNQTVKATNGEEGFEAKLKDLTAPESVAFNGSAGTFPLSAKSLLPEGSPINWATTTFDSWYRTGDYRWSGSPSIVVNNKTWLSTGDIGNGTEAQWMTGLYYTPWLNVTGKTLEFNASGTGDCRVMLIDEYERTILETWFPQNNDSKV